MSLKASKPITLEEVKGDAGKTVCRKEGWRRKRCRAAIAGRKAPSLGLQRRTERTFEKQINRVAAAAAPKHWRGFWEVIKILNDHKFLN